MGIVKWSLAVLCGLIGPVMAMGAYDSWRIGPVEARVWRDFAPVVTALERFASEKGGYPETLEALVPRYLPALPNCPVVDTTILPSGRPARYHKHAQGDFTLGCFVGVMVFPQDAVYFSAGKSWGRLD